MATVEKIKIVYSRESMNLLSCCCVHYEPSCVQRFLSLAPEESEFRKNRNGKV